MSMFQEELYKPWQLTRGIMAGAAAALARWSFCSGNDHIVRTQQQLRYPVRHRDRHSAAKGLELRKYGDDDVSVSVRAYASFDFVP